MDMEVEAKFCATPSICRQLASLEQLAGYRLHRLDTTSVRDHYYDTPDQALRRHGYALRLRRNGRKIVATLKSLTPATDAGVHRREEYELTLPRETTDVASWPADETRTRVLILTEGHPLERLFSITQRRQKWHIIHEGHVVAELSCDAVEAAAHDAHTNWHELEVELAGAGTETDLSAIIDELRTQLNVTPESRSKYERGLDLLG